MRTVKPTDIVDRLTYKVMKKFFITVIDGDRKRKTKLSTHTRIAFNLPLRTRQPSDEGLKNIAMKGVIV